MLNRKKNHTTEQELFVQGIRVYYVCECWDVCVYVCACMNECPCVLI